MVEAMAPGSVIVDIAAVRGGNCELTAARAKPWSINGVTILGPTNFAVHGSLSLQPDVLGQRRPRS